MDATHPAGAAAPASAHLYHLSLLGGFTLVCNGRQLRTLTAPRLQSLLAYLILNAQKQLDRSLLASTFWPELSEETARGHLRKTLFKLKEGLPASDDPFELTKTTVSWKYEPLCDVLELEALLLQPRSTSLVRRIQQLYLGALLPGCTDAWCLERREQVEFKVLRCLDEVLDGLERARSWAELIDVSRFRLQLDGLHEQTYHRLFRTFLAQGDRQAAKKVWLDCKEMLAKELDVEPSEAFTQDWERLNAPPTVEARAPSTAVQSRLVGRISEWAALLEVWQQTCQGQVRVVLLSGVSGIGKTRLATELQAHVQKLGHLASSAECRATEQRLAFSALGELLEGLPVASLPTSVLSEVSRVMPSLAEKFPELPSPPPLQEPGQRQRFFQAVARYVTEREPVLLLLDDAQWADEATLEWFLYLLRTSAAKKVLLLVTIRPEILSAGSLLLSEFIPAVRKLKRVLELSLGPLSHQESRELLCQEAKGAVSGHVIDELHVEAEGTPLYLLELLRARYLEGAQMLRAGEYPHTLTDAVALRLGVLSPLPRATLELIAVLGVPAQPRLLSDALGKPELEVLDALDELRQRHLVEERADLSYRIAHGLIGAILYRMMSLARRRLLHKTLAELLETHFVSGQREGGRQLAFHFERCLLPDRAARYYVVAGEASFRLGAMSEARQLFEQGLACTGAPLEVRIQALELLFDVNHWMGGYTACLELVRELQKLLQGTSEVRALAMAYVKESNVLQFVGRLSEAGVPLTKALELNVEGGELLRQEALLLRAELRLNHFELGPIREDYERALEQVRRLDGHFLEAGDRIPGIITLLSCGLLAEVRQNIDAALTQAQAEGRRDCESVVLYWSAFARMVQGEIEAAEADFYESIRLAKGLEYGGSVFRNQVNLARLLALRGRLRSALGLCRELEPTVETGSEGERMRLQAEYGLMLGLSGQLEKGMELLAAALEGARGSGNVRGLFRWQSYQAWLALAYGRLDLAESLVSQVHALLPWDVLAPVCDEVLGAAPSDAGRIWPGTLIDIAITDLGLRGELLLRKGHLEQAVPLLERAARLRPFGLMAAVEWDPHISLAEALLKLDRTAEGLKEWRAVYAATGGNPTATLGLPRFLAVGAQLEVQNGAIEAAARLEQDARRALHRLSLEVSEPDARRALEHDIPWHRALSKSAR